MAKDDEEGPFITGSTGLRDVSLDVGLGTRRARIRYIPLALLAVAVVVAALIGLWAQRVDHASTAAALAGESLSAEVQAACRPSVDQALSDSEYWQGSAAESAEAEFNSRISESPVALSGEDGMVFLSDVYSMNVSQAVGRKQLTSDEIQSWLNYFSVLRYELDKLGSDLLILVAPAKWDIYPDNLPEWARSIRGENSYDALLNATDSLPVVDVRAILRSSETPTYGDVNSHWNPYGAYLAWEQIVTCLQTMDSEMYSGFEVPEIVQVSVEATPSEFVDQGFLDSTDWFTPSLDIDLPESVDMLRLPYEGQGSGEVRTMLVRDSMGQAIGPYFENFSSWSIQIDNDFDTGENRPDIVALADQYDVDLVVIEFAERYLIVPPVL